VYFRLWSITGFLYQLQPLSPTPNLEDQDIPFCLGHHLHRGWHGRPYQQLRYRQHTSLDDLTTQAPPLCQSRDTFSGVTYDSNTVRIWILCNLQFEWIIYALYIYVLWIEYYFCPQGSFVKRKRNCHQGIIWNHVKLWTENVSTLCSVHSKFNVGHVDTQCQSNLMSFGLFYVNKVIALIWIFAPSNILAMTHFLQILLNN